MNRYDIVFAQSTNQSFYLSEEFRKDAAVAIISAILALLTGYILLVLTNKQSPKEQISYSSEIKSIGKDLIDIEKSEVKKKISVLYNGQEIENLYYVSFNIENTGNKPVRDEQIRFEFPLGSRVTDCFYDPEPTREMNVQELHNLNLPGSERAYLIAYLAPKIKIGFRFVIAATENSGMSITPHPYNEATYVEFIPRTVKVLEDKKYQVAKFLIFILFLFIVPPILFSLPFAGVWMSTTIRIILFILILPLIHPFTLVAADFLLKSSSLENNISLSGQDNYLIYAKDSITSSPISISRVAEPKFYNGSDFNQLLDFFQINIEREADLSKEDKEDLLEQIKALTEASQNINDIKMQKQAKLSIKILKGVIAGLPNNSNLVETSSKLLPEIVKYLGLT